MFAVAGSASQRHKLWHYHFDVWCLLPASSGECLRRGYPGCGDYREEHLLCFKRGRDGFTEKLEWVIEGVLLESPRTAAWLHSLEV